MILFKNSNQLAQYLEGQRSKGFKTGFCPTMGALHAGHISLIKSSKKENDTTISSIFVNPAQFNDPKDFEKYPITIEKDIDMLEEAGCDILFIPSVDEIYPKGFKVNKHYELGFLETILEGEYRPGHYQGVCAVMEILLKIVLPHNLYLGQKDFQQCMVISKLVELIGLDKMIHINICPTMREADGLAMSSRNMRLNAEERKTALTIYNSLLFIKNNFHQGNTEQIKNKAVSLLKEKGFKIDYVAIAHAENLNPISDWDGNEKAVALVAAYLNEVRLIDNMLLN
ncbi:MAG: pantoate--beta-alanine ligase [Bacteroidetes bacterium]|nr:MAG: pantoate--beta-alanine ligase [Bacteroidota bacterium]